MSVKEFVDVVAKLESFRAKLEKSGIYGKEQQVVLRLFLQEISGNRINATMLQQI